MLVGMFDPIMRVFVPNWVEGAIEKVAARMLGTKFRHALVLRMLVSSILVSEQVWVSKDY